MRIRVNPALGLGYAGFLQQFNGASARFVRPQGFVQFEYFTNLIANRVQRIQGRHGLLKNHADVGPANAAHGLLAVLAQVGAIEVDGAGGVGTLYQPQDGQGRDGFARARLPHQCKFFTWGDRKRNLIDHQRVVKPNAQSINFK